MREDIFIRQNREKWEGYEKKLGITSSLKAEEVSTIYQEVLTDLAFAQSQFPESRIVHYLNGLSKKYHQKVYAPRVFSLRQFVKLVSQDVPGVIVEARRELLLALVLFMGFVVAAVIFSVRDENYCVEILGGRYVDMTLENIANGRPTDVYNNDGEAESFVWILFNNFRVSMRMYASGIIPLVGPLYFIKANGLMVGAFQTLFFLHGAGFVSMTAIWIHGAFEISALVIAAGSAIALGKGWVFPGSYTRIQALKASGLRSVKIFASTLPLTFVAAFFEGFLTRQTQLPLALKLAVIFGCFGFVVFYYVALPYKIYRNQKQQGR